jgi:hypothetical protein
MDWKDIVRTVAPTAAGLLGTPAAGVAVKVLADALLGGSSGDPKKDEADVAALVNTNGLTPELRAKMIDAEAEVKQQAFELRKALIDQDTTMYKADVDDRVSARRAAVEGDNAKRVFWLTVTIFVLVVGIEAAVLFVGVPEGLDGQLAGRILGTFDAALLAAVYYTFGSSAGSARKDRVSSQRRVQDRAP